MPKYAMSGPMLDREKIVDIIKDPRRKSGRRLFGPEFIKNQKHLGACNGFACASVVEKTRVRRGRKLVKMSGFAMYSAINGGRDHGSMLEDGMKWMTDKGVPVELPNEQPEFRWNRISQAQKDSMSQNKAVECYHLTTELELASACASGFDCVIAVHASDRWMQLDKDGVSAESHGVGNHSVHVDDVIVLPSGEFAFDMANSWALTFGQQGRSYQTWKRHLRSTVENHYFFAVRSTTDGDGEKPPIPKGN
jgi:hypothetical protein